jgi:predicted dehydrogenase
MAKLKVAVIGLRMGAAWATAAHTQPNTILSLVYDKFYAENDRINKSFFVDNQIPIAKSEEEVYASDADIVVVASPDHFHCEQSIKALRAGKHVACEKPLASNLDECRQIIAAVKESGKFFMTGQVCRYAPGFALAKHLLTEGRIGELVYLESEHAQDYTHDLGFQNWRSDRAVNRHVLLSGGCHAMDLMRWLAGDPSEVFCYMNQKYLPDCPTPDTGVAVAKFPADVLGRVFVSVGVKRPYTMRTVINGTQGTIICDNTSEKIQLCEASSCRVAQKLAFAEIPVQIASQNVASELADFVNGILQGRQCPTDVYQGTRTVAFAEAAIKSAQCGLPVPVEYDF